MPPTKTKSKFRRLVSALRPYDPEKIYLFGSHARNEADELSDMDVVVIKRTQAPFLDRLKEIAKLLPSNITKIDLFVYTPEEFTKMLKDGNAFAETVAEEGKPIYAKSEKN